MMNIAILGFGVVGHGVRDLLWQNKNEVLALGGNEINIKYILDLRDFPNDPDADLVVHDITPILEDDTVEVIIEVMGGSHPAYEYTVAALRRGKHVITSNKEVVAGFGAEFLSIAKEMGVVYRFEASVGGGIPVISPIISQIKHNKIREVRGILNGTTNYILTKMFTFGESFENALRDAQAKGYAEANPDADILGTDACRKIAILAALVSGKAVPPERIHTEGITKIRAEDVKNAAKCGYAIKLLGRCILTEDGMLPFVAPFLVPEDSALYTVGGVYNAVEVVAEPLGNVLFYGQGAGAGATASAVVGDLMLTLREGTSYAAPVFATASEDEPLAFDSFACRHYVAAEPSESLRKWADSVRAQILSDGEELAFLTPEMKEGDFQKALASEKVLSHIRVL